MIVRPLISGLLLVPTLCQASALPDVGKTCFAHAAHRYGLDEPLLRAIATVESNFVVGAVHLNCDGTHDVGIMQINSSHFGELQRRWRLDEQALLDQPCVNVFVGASILAGFVARFGATWRAVGSYGAGTAPGKEAARVAYARVVSRALARLTRAQPVPRARVAAGPTSQAPDRPRLLVLE